MRIFILFIGLFLLPFLAQAQSSETLDPKFTNKINSIIDKSIPTISCERLKLKTSTPNLFLLDAREEKEYKISHLEDAIWVGYKTFDPKYVKDVPKDAIVVVYCSIGYRSEKIGERLKKLGYSKVYNLYGGIFEWANREYPLVNQDNKSTKTVHAYDRDWGKWVNKCEKVYK